MVVYIRVMIPANTETSMVSIGDVFYQSKNIDVDKT
jgi:hypothetical protein